MCLDGDTACVRRQHTVHLHGLAAKKSAALVQGTASLQAASSQFNAVLQQLSGVHQRLVACGHAILCLQIQVAPAGRPTSRWQDLAVRRRAQPCRLAKSIDNPPSPT